jgi:hypothetical protein
MEYLITKEDLMYRPTPPSCTLLDICHREEIRKDERLNEKIKVYLYLKYKQKGLKEKRQRSISWEGVYHYRRE